MYVTFAEAAAFNQPIGAWDVSGVTTLGYMFWGAAAFDQNISAWDVSKVTTMTKAFHYSGLRHCPSWAVGKNAAGPC